ncbi:ankyrin repeat domain-containing protein [Pyrenochaeta sp. MPI-SDFR-AT-0127]|nr:ankyrin repeat domain-containing protein [Pyrenochaeta sp. MPI-SDFR-AT-0127]
MKKPPAMLAVNLSLVAYSQQRCFGGQTMINTYRLQVLTPNDYLSDPPCPISTASDATAATPRRVHRRMGALLDEKHDDFDRDANDENIYCMGSMAGHNVVIVCLPAGQIGNNPAAAVATQMRATFTGIRFGLMVGIGGGVPSGETDIRLGDVVVSQPHQTSSGVVQYDIGKTTPTGFKRTGSLNSPPQILLSAVSNIQSDAILGKSTLSGYISELELIPAFQRSKAGPDILFQAAYDHLGGPTCVECLVDRQLPRPHRESTKKVVVHHGTIASGNQVMRCAAERDQRWQPYAAGTAAAYAKELLSVIPATDVIRTRRAEEAINSASKRGSLPLSPDRVCPKRRKVDILNDIEYNNTQYLEWLDATKLGEHNGFLWIKGKAGAGKSTLMKFAMINARKTMKDRITLSFFFNARGENIEKSTIGTYRSLLLQLIERLPALQSVFDSLGLSTSTFSADHQWNIELLQTLLREAIQALGEYSVVRDMIQFFEQVGELAVTNRIRFQVCFSSRHYPYITIRKGLELVLEGQEGHTQDITNYIETELKIGKSKKAQQVRVELQEKASGIFMWVVLVVGILNKESDRGQVQFLQRKLREIPSDLHELFHDILTRDTHNREGLVLCIQWILFSKQPLSPEQLYHAIFAGTAPNAVSAWDSEETSKEVVKRFILDSSKGLAEATVSKKQTVQFIHESVRVFLLKENGLSKIWPEFECNFEGQSHERLKWCCFNYMTLDFSATLKISESAEKTTKQDAAGMRELAMQAYPFLEYAVHHVLHHADLAEERGITQAHFFDSLPLPQWVKLDNMFEKHEVRKHTEQGADVNAQGGHFGNALQAASAGGHKEMVILLLDKGADVNAQGGYYGNALQAASFRGYKDIAILLLDKGADVNAQGGHFGNALQAASAGGHKEMVILLLDKGADVNAQGGYYGNALQAASAGGHKEIALLLLDKGADVNTQGGHFDKGADVNAQGGRYGNALQAAAASIRGDKEIVTLLLDKGADVNAKGGRFDNALQAASNWGHKEIEKLLLERGAVKTPP